MKKISYKTLLLVFMIITLPACSPPTATNNAQNIENKSVEITTENPAELSKNGSYISYDKYIQDKDKYLNTKVIIFFNAAWCSTCKVARENFESSLNMIPRDMTIAVVDFDNSNDLRKKYGVTLQHTFVQIDQNEDSLKKWSGSTTIKELTEASV